MFTKNGFIFYLTLLLSCFIITTPSFSAQQQASDHHSFITISDIHFDPFYMCADGQDCPQACDLVKKDVKQWDQIFKTVNDKGFPNYGEETNYDLFISTLKKSHAVAQEIDPDFIVILGDSIVHKFSGTTGKYKQFTTHCAQQQSYPIFVNKLMRFLAVKLKTNFPDRKIYPLMGNNDSVTGNYSVEPDGYLLNQLKETWLPLIEPNDPQMFFQTFAKDGGYYAIDVSENLKLIVLNTVLFSPLGTTPDGKRALYANKQLKWLEQQLSQAKMKQQSVLLAYHIPPGIDVFKSILGWAISQWDQSYTTQFVDMVSQYQHTIVAQLTSHIHTDGFYLVTNKDNEPISYLTTTPSITPIYGNNPGFKVYEFTPDPFMMIDFSSYYLDLQSEHKLEWKKEYTFTEVYGRQYSPITTDNIYKLLHSKGFQQGNNQKAEHYKRFFALGGVNASIQYYWQKYWCGMNYTMAENYRNCVLS